MSPLRKCKVLAFILLLSTEASYGDKVEEKFFDQALDHSGKTPGTWKQVNNTNNNISSSLILCCIAILNM